MADWTKLPTELLELISKRLTTYYDTICFRSVCSIWRSVVTSPNRNLLALYFPVHPCDSPLWVNSNFTISKRTVVILGSPKSSIQTNPSTSWVIKIGEDVLNNKIIRLFKPFSRYPLNSLPDNFPKALNLLEFRVFELGVEYVLHNLTRPGCLYVKKLVLSRLGNNINDSVLLALHVTGSLVMFKSRDKRWVKIKDMPRPTSYDDVILYEGNFYAIDCVGRTVLVGLDSEINVVGMPVLGGNKKFLVESKGELLLVVMNMKPSIDVKNLASYMDETTVGFKVFKLDQVGNRWIEVKGLNDRVLFLGELCSFCASAEELSVCRGNYIIFSGNFFSMLRKDEESEQRYAGVFDLETGSAGPIQKFPQFSNLFWPPPHWISSSTTLDAQRLYIGELD